MAPASVAVKIPPYIPPQRQHSKADRNKEFYPKLRSVFGIKGAILRTTVAETHHGSLTCFNLFGDIVTAFGRIVVLRVNEAVDQQI